MALLPKASPIQTTAPLASNRAVTAGARVASISTSQVDAVEAGTNISFDTAATAYQENFDQSRLDRDGRRQQRDGLREPSVNRLFTSNTELFAEIFENDRPRTASQNNADAGRAGAGTPVQKIISTYETNALIISGQQTFRGTTVSFSL